MAIKNHGCEYWIVDKKLCKLKLSMETLKTIFAKRSSFDAWQSCYPDGLLNLNREIREDDWFEDMRSKLYIG